MAASTRPAPRVVVDTNLVLSALVFGGGTPGALRCAWQNHRCHPLVSTATVAELLRALAYPKFRLDPVEQEELLADYLPWCRTVQIPDPPPRTPPCRDPFDRPFLELALAGSAEFLLTGDADLLELRGRLRCPVLTAAAFLDALPLL